MNKKNIRFFTKDCVFEDNDKPIVVVYSPHLTPTSKFIDVKYHSFCYHINQLGGITPITIHKIDGTRNISEIVTKRKSK